MIIGPSFVWTSQQKSLHKLLTSLGIREKTMVKFLDALQARLSNAELVGFNIAPEQAFGEAVTRTGKAAEAKSGLGKPDAPSRASMAKYGTAKTGLSKVGAIKT
jgi:hypothetical protein